LLIAIFLAGYGMARATAEFFRESDSPLYGPFSMGMLLSLPMWAAAAFFFWYAYRQKAS
jgi:phosphatidylglycerol:prolipoprotein diacylglycerol transferase